MGSFGGSSGLTSGDDDDRITYPDLLHVLQVEFGEKDAQTQNMGLPCLHECHTLPPQNHPWPDRQSYGRLMEWDGVGTHE